MHDKLFFNQLGRDYLPGHLGISIIAVEGPLVHAEMQVTKSLMAPNGFLHAGSIVSLADTAAGYGCVANLPKDATGFTTIELKSNHLATAREGRVLCIATAVHLGGRTQIWDASVTHQETGKQLALFRCTQMLLFSQ